MQDEERGPQETADEALLREIRDNYRYYSDAWKEHREERRIDMRYLCGDPWEEADRKARKDAGRPCINHDELNQYVNACVNSARQNKRGIKVDPRGNGANDKTAEFRQDLIRTIEYRCNAQSIYLRAYQDEVEGSYGFCRVSRKYVSWDSDDQEIVIKPIANPDSVLYDPDCKEPDWSDARGCFLLDPMPREEFKRRFPTARVTDFGPEEMRVARDWIGEKTVLVAEYWRVEHEEIKRPKRTAIKKHVWQYITNGVEILERTEQPGDEIPIPAFIGMERWIDDGSGPKRKLFSLPRLARDPQMSLAYLCTLEMEEAALTPKVPYKGYTGQFETDMEAWENITKVPRGFVQADPIVDAATNQVLPLPTRETFTPNFQAYEIAKDSCRRSIQAAMGINPLPTAAQRNNEKSGVALQKIQAQQEIGSFHFADGFDRGLTRLGRIVDSWLKVTYDTEKEIALRKADDSTRIVTINTADPYQDPQTQQELHFDVAEGDHDVTISTGPSASSQRDAASDFLDVLISNLQTLPVAPPQAAKLLSLAIKMKQLGPLGDEMAELISPTDQGQQIPPQMQAAMAQAKQQLQAMNAYAQQLEGELKHLQAEKQAKVVDNEYRMAIEKLKIDAQLAMAEVTTKSQQLNERIQFVEDVWKQLHSQAHEAGMQAEDQAHQANQQAAAAQQASDAQASDQQHQQGMAEQQAAAQQQTQQETAA